MKSASEEFERAEARKDGEKRTVDLSNQAEYWDVQSAWPTATGRDQASSWEPLHPAPQIHLGIPFSQRVRILLRLCRLLRERLPSPYNKARSIFKRRLNPNFVDFLMGWPIGWSSEDRDFSAEEMALWRYRQLSALQFLLGDSDSNESSL